LADPSFALWKPDPTDPFDRSITTDADAQIPDKDEDNGVRLVGDLQPGFSANFEISVHNENNLPFYVDAWFDWNGNGAFEVDESRRFGSSGTGRSLLSTGTNVISVTVPSTAALGEIYARFRLSEVGSGTSNLGPNGDAVRDIASGALSRGEVEDIQLVVGNNPFQNPARRFDVNDSGVVTPLDALQIINAIGRNEGNNILLDVLPLPANLPIFPDVSGDSVVSALDALQVINELARLPNSAGGSGEFIGEGEATSFVPLSAGVLASGATFVGDVLIAQARESEASETKVVEEVSTVTAPPKKTSVFDSAPVVAVESIVESLAEDTAGAREDGDNAALDQLFASF
jgi:hypothetical protein